jgi:hypothetical protein
MAAAVVCVALVVAAAVRSPIEGVLAPRNTGGEAFSGAVSPDGPAARELSGADPGPARSGPVATVSALATALAAPRGAVVPAADPTSSHVERATANPTAHTAPGPLARMRTPLDVRFSEPQEGWPSDPLGTAWFAGTTYQLFARVPAHFVAVSAPTSRVLRDVVVTGTFRKIGGPPGGGYGLIVRDQGPGPSDGQNQVGHFYVAEVGDRGEVGVWRRDGDHWVDLLPWTVSRAVRPGWATNEVALQALGNTLTLVVNGREVAQPVDSVLEDGVVGLFVGGAGNEVPVERFSAQSIS